MMNRDGAHKYRSALPYDSADIGSVRVHRSTSMESHHVRVYVSIVDNDPSNDFVIIEALKNTPSEDVVRSVAVKRSLGRSTQYELVETFMSAGQIIKERRMDGKENPVRVQLHWPKTSKSVVDGSRIEYRFFVRKKDPDKKIGEWIQRDTASTEMDGYIKAFVSTTDIAEYSDLCDLPELNETTLLDNLKFRFENSKIYTYIVSILIAVNPFKFYPIYNPTQVSQYQNKRLSENPPHIFAIADAAFHSMLTNKQNQCIVISGESGSGKTESTNLLLSQLSALSQKGAAVGDGVEKIILGAGPVLEAFGNAKTVHNNNSSRFGKFIQVNFKENGIVHGAVVEKYLLEKSRLVHQAPSERNYHVFYYLLVGCSEEEKQRLGLTKPDQFRYLSQSLCYVLEDAEGIVDEQSEFVRLVQSMETVGFSRDTQTRIWQVLAAVLHLGNVEFDKRRHTGNYDAVKVLNPETITRISQLLHVKEATLTEALTKRKSKAGGETLVISLDFTNANSTRDAMAKCLYSALFDWIVLQVNQALISKRDFSEHNGNSIGVLDIFGFEDFGNNSFEQFLINYANEHLQQYFNQHVFKYEQEEYVKEGILWKNIEFTDNKGCLDLFAKRPTGLLCLLDEECNFPGANNESLLVKFNSNHKAVEYYDTPQMREDAFFIVHYAGKVKYSITDFREKNLDMMRHDVMMVLKNSSQAFVRELVGYDPVAMMRWSIVRVFFRAFFALIEGGKRYKSRDLAPVKYGSTRPKLSEDGGRTGISSAFNVSTEQRTASGGRILIIEKSASVDNVPNASSRQSTLSNGGGGQTLWEGGHLDEHDYRVLKKANRVLQKAKQPKSKSRTLKQLRDLQRMQSMTSTKQPVGPRPSKSKAKPPSVGAQFNNSLQKLLETLHKSNPFFIRCIKSNMEKQAQKFDDAVVLRQLRYTGMLATVRIRQRGYSYRVTHEVFLSQYRILLPRSASKDRTTLERFLNSMDLKQNNYQIGLTKVFLREAEKMVLDQALHCEIMRRIVELQHWFRAMMERQRFVRMRRASVIIQAGFRRFMAQQEFQRLRCIVLIQKMFRGYRQRRRLADMRRAAVILQAHVRGYLVRNRLEKGLKLTSFRVIQSPGPGSGAYDNMVLFPSVEDKRSHPRSQTPSSASPIPQEGNGPEDSAANSADDEGSTDVFDERRRSDTGSEDIAASSGEERRSSRLSDSGIRSVVSTTEPAVTTRDSTKREDLPPSFDLQQRTDAVAKALSSQRSLSDSGGGAKSPGQTSPDVEFALTLTDSRRLRRSISHQSAQSNKSKSEIPYRPKSPCDNKTHTSSPNLATHPAKQPSLDSDNIASAATTSGRKVSIDGEFEVPEITTLPPTPVRRSSRPLSTTRVTHLDELIASQATESKTDTGIVEGSIPEVVADSRTVVEREEDEWHRLEVEFKPNTATPPSDVYYKRSDSLKSHETYEPLSPTGSTASEHSVFMSSETDRKVRYLVHDSVDGNAHNKAVDLRDTQTNSATTSLQSNLDQSNDSRVENSSVIEPAQADVSSGGDSTVSTPVAPPPVDRSNKPRGSTGGLKKDRLSSFREEYACGILSTMCETCSSLGVRASHSLNCPDCGQLRAEAAAMQRTSSVDTSLLTSSRSQPETPRRGSLRDKERSVAYLGKVIYGEDNEADQMETVRSTSHDKNSHPRTDSMDKLAESTQSPATGVRSDIARASSESVLLPPRADGTSRLQDPRYVVQEESDNMMIVERTRTPQKARTPEPYESDAAARVGRGSGRYVADGEPLTDGMKRMKSESSVIQPQFTVFSSQKAISSSALAHAHTLGHTPTHQPLTPQAHSADRREPRRENSFMITIKKKYQNVDPLQSEQKIKAYSTSNLHPTIRVKPRHPSPRSRSPADEGGMYRGCVGDEGAEEGSTGQSPLNSTEGMPEKMSRNTPYRKPISKGRSLDKSGGAGDQSLSASDDSTLNRVSSSEELERSAGLPARPPMMRPINNRTPGSAGRRPSHDDTLSELLPGALGGSEGSEAAAYRHKYSDDGRYPTEMVSYDTRGRHRDSAGSGGGLHRSTSEEHLYGVGSLRADSGASSSRSSSHSARSSKRQSAPLHPSAAPLARMESLNEPAKHDPRIVTRYLTRDDEDRITFTIREPDDVVQGPPSATSPFTLKTFKTLRNKLTGPKNRKKSGNELDGESDESGDEDVKAAHPTPERVKEAWAATDNRRGRDTALGEHKSHGAGHGLVGGGATVRSKKTPTGGSAGGAGATTHAPSRSQNKSKKQQQRNSKGEAGNTWAVKQRALWQYPEIVVVKDFTELKQLTSFMFKKKTEWEKNCRRGDSALEKIFNGAFNDFINELMLTESQNTEVEFPYATLMKKFEDSFGSRMALEKDMTDAQNDLGTLVINPFRSYLDEFCRLKEKKQLPEISTRKVYKEKKKHKKNKENFVEVNGHRFAGVQLQTMHTVCEECNKRTWLLAGYECRQCHYAVCKKCLKNTKVPCSQYASHHRGSSQKVFGVALLTLMGDTERVPHFLERIFQEVENQGLYTVGIYRKVGQMATIKQLEAEINKGPSLVKLSDYNIHVLCSLLKKFLRDLPEPLMTFDLYPDFIRHSQIQDQRQRTKTLYGIIDKLSVQHFIVLERLINHLARIAKHEAFNKMSPSALAIVFAPSILRTNANVPVQESLEHVPKQSMCVQTIIEEQLRKIGRTLEDMNALESASNTAEQRLSSIRESRRSRHLDEVGASGPSPLDPVVPEEEEANFLSQQILDMQQEREKLGEGMGQLGPCSDDEQMTEESTGDELEFDDDVKIKSLTTSPTAKRKKRPSLHGQRADQTGEGAAASSLAGRGLMSVDREEYL